MKQSPNRAYSNLKMEEIRSFSTYQTTTLRHVITKTIAVLRSTNHFRSSEYKHKVITYLHQNTNYCRIFFKPNRATSAYQTIVYHKNTVNKQFAL